MSFHFILSKHVGGILVGERLQPKFFNVVSIDPLYLRMLLITVRVALGANS